MEVILNANDLSQTEICGNDNSCWDCSDSCACDSDASAW